MVSLLRQASEKLVICEILHLTNLNRNLVYSPWLKDLTTLQVVITLNGINVTSAFLKKKKKSIHSLLKKVVFCEISDFSTFPKYFFIHCKDLEQPYRYLKFKCYQSNDKVFHYCCHQSCFLKNCTACYWWFVTSHFSYFPMVCLFHSQRLNNYINHIH